ncbi:MAG TPA: glycine zipper 2TM domain-containing protein [Gammaproteobacteria bacterium]
MNRISSVFLVLALMMTAGCASSAREQPVETYERDRVGEVQRVESGRIISLTPVEIEGNESKVGTVLGAVAGGLAGRQLGSGSGQDIMTVIGAVAGGYAGSELSEGEVRADGVEIGIKMDDGREISIVQELEENEMFRVGEQVSVVFNGDKARVEH